MELIRRLRYLLSHRQADADLAEELEFHRALNQQAGGDPRALGNLTRAREDARAVWISPWLQSVWQDAAYAVRNLRRQPAFTLVALVTLGAAIGLNTSLFTVFHLIALQPWPVKDAAHVVRVLQNGHGLSLAEFRDLANGATKLAGLTVQRDRQLLLDAQTPAPAAFVDGSFFHLLGVEMELGRGFLPAEDRWDMPQPVVVLGNAFWLEHFHADPQIVDKQIQVEGRAFTVVGVTSRAFTPAPALWLPIAAIALLEPPGSASAQALFTDPGVCCAGVLARLAPGISAASVEAELNLLNTRFRSQAGLAPLPIELTRTAPFQDPKGHVLPLFGLMFLAVILVMLLSCANIGNLLLARAQARRSEIYVRFSVGASRARIVRQLMTESLLLAIAAAALGLAAAFYLPAVVLRQFHQDAPFHPTPDAFVLAYALALAVFSCVCFGLAPALHASRPGDGRMRMRSWLLAAEVAMSVVLLVGASLLTKAVSRSRSLNLGFTAAGVTLVSFEFLAGAYDANSFHSRLLDALHSAPGLGAFGLAEREPLSNRFLTRAATQYGWIEVQSVSSGYFDVLKIPIVDGRNLDDADAQRRAILVNQTMANRHWGGHALGQQFRVGDSFRQVVGVVHDTYSTSAGLERIDPVVYQPLPLKRTSGFGRRPVPKVLVRDSAGAAEAIAAAVAAIDPQVHVQAEPLSDSVERWLDPARTGAAIAGLLGLFALVLAAIGMSGVFGYVVRQRTREIGIRMALGARPAEVVRLVLSGTARSVAVGAAAGFLTSVPVSQWMRQRLPGISPFDPVAYVWVAIALTAAALAASFLPVRRATQIDPMSALRCE